MNICTHAHTENIPCHCGIVFGPLHIFMKCLIVMIWLQGDMAFSELSIYMVCRTNVFIGTEFQWLGCEHACCVRTWVCVCVCVFMCTVCVSVGIVVIVTAVKGVYQ